MDVDPLLERKMRIQKEEALHSSGYARAEQGERIGSTSAESFAARQKWRRGRQSEIGLGENRGAERRKTDFHLRARCLHLRRRAEETLVFRGKMWYNKVA